MDNIALWDVSLDTECPVCGDEFDILNSDNASDTLKGVDICHSGDELDVCCPKCEYEFTVKTAH